jgi:hypothetical protein
MKGIEIEIEKAIRETLVITNGKSVNYAVAKIMKIIEKSKE